MYERMKELFRYYIAHQDEFIARYNGKSILLVDFDVKGVFEDDLEAIQFACKEFTPGSFIVQKVSPGVEAYTVSIASNFVFAGV